jgi:hypothetical protein
MLRKGLAICLIALPLFGLLLGGGLVFFARYAAPLWPDDLCEIQVGDRLVSPNGKHRAVTFVRSCGATTGCVTKVAILPTHQAFTLDEPGATLFSADDDHGAVPSDGQRGLAIRLRWLDSGKLEIAYPRHARIFSAEPQRQGVSAMYLSF